MPSFLPYSFHNTTTAATIVAAVVCIDMYYYLKLIWYLHLNISLISPIQVTCIYLILDICQGCIKAVSKDHVTLLLKQ